MNGKVSIFCKNTGKYINVNIGYSLLKIFKEARIGASFSPVSALVNNRTEDLNYRCWHPVDVEFVNYQHPAGRRTYIRSLCFIFAKAVYDVFPNATLRLEHSISKGYYCFLQENGRNLSQEEILRIKERMLEITSSNIFFQKVTEHTSHAIELFKLRGMMDKVRLIETSGMLYTTYYALDGYIDYFYGCLTPSTKYIHTFDIMPYGDGVLLRIPQAKNSKKLEPFVHQEKMMKVFKENLELLASLKLDNVGDLNLAIQKGYASEVIMVSEATQEKQIARIAYEITQRYKEGVRIVLIAGPSSSGKTTTCKRLEIQLITNMIRPVGISLDDYFVNREDTPKDKSGNYDFESINALDIHYFNNDLKRLLAGEEIDMPSFDFTTGKRVFKGKRMKLYPNSVVVIEGIHALNPKLTQYLDDALKYRIYVSALTTISLDDHNWIPTTDNRLLRRIVRDAQFRGYTAEQTIQRWPSVRQGEDKWIFPFQEKCDAMFNSAMLYEFAALKPYVEPILREVPESSNAYSEAYRLLRFLQYFKCIPKEELPQTSLLCEFLGGGKFKY